MDIKDEKEMNWPKILLIGDSLTQLGYSDSGKWVALLADLFQRKCDVINRGFSGYTTRSIKPFIPNIITENLVSGNVATVVFLGANDSNLKELNEAQHVPLEEYKSNLQEIIDILGKKGILASKILLVPPPPCNEEMWRKSLEIKTNSPVERSSKNNETTRRYYDACLQMANKLHCRTFANPDDYWNSLNASVNFCDGLHFSESGSQIVFKFISQELREMTKDLPMILPDWKDICKANKL